MKALCEFGHHGSLVNACERDVVRDGLCEVHADNAELEFGQCDHCEARYYVWSQEDHCGECGTCFDHCDCA